MGTIVNRQELAEELAKLRKQGKKIVTTNGCFDILHVGHMQILNQAKALGDVLVVGVNSDASVERLKGKERPVITADDRAELLANLNSVDYVTIFEEDTPTEFLEVAKPDIHVKGADYEITALEEAPLVESYGGKVVLLKLRPGRSTTNLIKKIRAL
jgi:rfaE bifunctional protein nucleotidyltransferase chain/domain